MLTEPAPSPASVAVLVPTLDECANVDPLLERVLASLERLRVPAEILVVDGGSTDGTRERVREWAGRGPVRLIETEGEGGLAADVLAAARVSDADLVVVMDADLSHPPEAIPDLVEPVLAGERDVVLGSRYTAGGRTEGWPRSRRLLSRMATLVASPLVSARDPMSGFFAVRRQPLVELAEDAAGFKIGLELLARGEGTLRVAEVPITFVDRQRGRSKLGAAQAWAGLRQALSLAGGDVRRLGRLAAGSALGLGVDLLVCLGALAADLGLALSQSAGFLAGALTTGAAVAARDPGRRPLVRFAAVAALAYAPRALLATGLVDGLGWAVPVALAPAVLLGSLVLFLGALLFAFPRRDPASAPTIRWRLLAVAAAAYAVLLRVLLHGTVDLFPEEAYYWAGAKRLAASYLDHPPATSWLIHLGTTLFGDTHLGVRLPALLCWSVTALFLYRLTRNLAGRTAGYGALQLVSWLPIYFTIGFLMTPDAPLHAAWAGSLYFLERALLARRGGAWLGVGLMLGVGLLSKYTIALLAPAILLFLLLDPSSRRWLVRPEPYLGAAVTAAVFSPVLVWNARHDWASFAYQGARRWAGEAQFWVDQLALNTLMVLTPLGVAAAVYALVTYRPDRPRDEPRARRRLFARVFTFLPLAIFVLNSLFKEPQINWTGPVWLAALPFLAVQLFDGWRGTDRRPLVRGLAPLWLPTAVGLFLFYGAGPYYYLLLGHPGLRPHEEMALPTAWEEVAHEVGALRRELRAERGREPVVVGLDTYMISSAIAFYDREAPDLDATAGRHLVGRRTVMWRYWLSQEEVVGRDLILVGFRRKELDWPTFPGFFEQLGPVASREVRQGGRFAGKFFYRVGYGYLGPQDWDEESKLFPEPGSARGR